MPQRTPTDYIAVSCQGTGIVFSSAGAVTRTASTVCADVASRDCPELGFE